MGQFRDLPAERVIVLVLVLHRIGFRSDALHLRFLRFYELFLRLRFARYGREPLAYGRELRFLRFELYPQPCGLPVVIDAAVEGELGLGLLEGRADTGELLSERIYLRLLLLYYFRELFLLSLGFGEVAHVVVYDLLLGSTGRFQL